jgi:RNA polymerase sigma factor (sigma-70 family)
MTLAVSQSLAQKDGAESEKDRFTRLAREFYEPVYFFVARQIGNKADAADVTQQVFLKGFQSFSRFDPSREFAPWIYTIARRCIADFFRSSKGHHEPVEQPAIVSNNPVVIPSLDNPVSSVVQLAGLDKPGKADLLMSPLASEQDRLAADVTNALKYVAQGIVPNQYMDQVNRHLDSFNREISSSI